MTAKHKSEGQVTVKVMRMIIIIPPLLFNHNVHIVDQKLYCFSSSWLKYDNASEFSYFPMPFRRMVVGAGVTDIS